MVRGKAESHKTESGIRRRKPEGSRVGVGVRTRDDGEKQGQNPHTRWLNRLWCSTLGRDAKERSKSMRTFYVSADVSMEHLDVATATSAASRKVLSRFANEAEGWISMAVAVNEAVQSQPSSDDPITTIHLILEPSGGYEEGLLYFAYAQGWLVTRVNPLKLRRWASGQGVRAKTDRVDALVLAWYGATVQPSPHNQMEEGAAELDELLRRRTDLEQLRRAESNRLGQLRRKVRPSRAVQQSIERTLHNLEEELRALEAAIQQLLKEHPALQQQRKLLASSPAVGEKLSLEMLVLCHRFDAYTQGQGTSKQIVAFVGLDPQPYESGKSKQRTSISHQGNSHLRSLLYLGALGGVRGHNPLRTWYHHLLAEGKPKKLALVACARKVLTWIWALFKSNTPFEPTRFVIPAHSHA
jgi:transposase